MWPLLCLSFFFSTYRRLHICPIFGFCAGNTAAESNTQENCSLEDCRGNIRPSYLVVQPNLQLKIQMGRATNFFVQLESSEQFPSGSPLLCRVTVVHNIIPRQNCTTISRVICNNSSFSQRHLFVSGDVDSPGHTFDVLLAGWYGKLTSHAPVLYGDQGWCIRYPTGAWNICSCVCHLCSMSCVIFGNSHLPQYSGLPTRRSHAEIIGMQNYLLLFLVSPLFFFPFPFLSVCSLGLSLRDSAV